MAARPVGLALAAALLALAALVGCQAGSPGPTQPGPVSQSPGEAKCESAPDAPNDPTGLYFPSQQVRVAVTRVGLTPAEDVDLVPLDRAPLVAGWYCYSPRPGDLGPSVMVGHVDWGGSKAAFGRLSALRKGDRIEVRTRAGRTHRFVIAGTQRVAKAAFPFDRVFGDSPVSALTLITCGGPFNRAAGTYTDSDIIYARADPTSG